MEIILKDDMAGVGFKHDIVKVKPGFARNFLIPQGLAIVASHSNKKMMAENARQAEHKAEKQRGDAQAIADSIGETILEIGAKAGDSGKIFGAITTQQISDAFKAKGFPVEKKLIKLTTVVKTVGEYEVELDLHREVKHMVTFTVVAE